MRFGVVCSVYVFLLFGVSSFGILGFEVKLKGLLYGAHCYDFDRGSFSALQGISCLRVTLGFYEGSTGPL